MIQKITLEIQNDTGLEFEDTIELRPLRRGDYWFNGHDKIVGPIDDDYGAHRHVLTPKVDAELEQAKKKFPVGSYYQDADHGDTIFKVKEVLRFGGPGRIVIHADSEGSDIETFGFDVPDCTPFPLPTWRCCASDKPKKSGEYAMRSKGSKKIFSGKYSIATAFWDWTSVIDCPYSDFEWLDEGEL